MGNARLGGLSPLILGMALAGLFVACEKSATGPETAALTETDLPGTWRASIPAVGFTVKVIMEIGADHSVNFTQKYTGVVPGAPDSAVDKSYESGTWSLSGGVLSSTKVACRYATPPAFQLQDTTCAAPITRQYSLAIKGNSMTVVEGTSTYVFLRD